MLCQNKHDFQPEQSVRRQENGSRWCSFKSSFKCIDTE